MRPESAWPSRLRSPSARAVKPAPGPAAQARDVYEELFELAPDAYVFTTPRGKVVHANRAACALLNCPHHAIHGCPLIVFMTARQYRHLLTDLPRAAADTGVLPEREILIQPLRRPQVAVAVTVGVARDGQGRKVGLRWMLRDISERKRVESRLHTSLHEKELLLREVYHRVKNNLQVISSLLSLQEPHLADPVAVSVLRNARDRVRSMALVHERLYRSADLSQVDFAEYLPQLAGELSNAYGPAAENIRFEFHLEQVRLGIDVAVPCSMIVHELLANALRHGFPDGRPGAITIVLRKEAAGRLRLIVSDDGVGLPRADASHRPGSLGLQLVEMMVEQIEGRLEVVREPGTRFEVAFPQAGAREAWQ